MHDGGQLAHRIDRQEGRRLVLALLEVDRHDAVGRAGLLEHPVHHLRPRARVVIEDDLFCHGNDPPDVGNGVCLHPDVGPVRSCAADKRRSAAGLCMIPAILGISMAPTVRQSALIADAKLATLDGAHDLATAGFAGTIATIGRLYDSIC